MRLYEARGLLATPTRTAAGYRLYTKATSPTAVIAAARRLGIHADQVAEILLSADDDQRPCFTTNQVLDQRIAEIDRAITELSVLRGPRHGT